MTHPTRSRRPFPLVAVVALALLLAPVAASCSSDEKADDPGTASTTTRAGDPGKGDGSTTTTGGRDEVTTTTGDVEPPLTVAAAEQPYVDALVKASVADGNTDLPLPQAQAECLAPRWVRALGVARFTEAGIAASDVTVGSEEGDSYFDQIDQIGDASTAQAFVDAFDECDIDLRAVVARLVGGGDISAEQEACLAAEFPLAPIQESLASALDGDDETMSNLEDPIGAAMEACKD